MHGIQMHLIQCRYNLNSVKNAPISKPHATGYLVPTSFVSLSFPCRRCGKWHHNRQIPAIPKTIRLNIDLSKLGVGISAAAAAADGELVELTSSAMEGFADAIKMRVSIVDLDEVFKLKTYLLCRWKEPIVDKSLWQCHRW